MHKNLAPIKTAFGFTLIELIIAIVIVVILTTIGVASFNSASRANAVRQQAQEIKSLARKLRTDASAAIKPSGDCSLAANNASIYGTYLNFAQTDTVTYGVLCFDQGTNDYSTVNTKTLPTGLKVGQTGFSNLTVFYSFTGGVEFFSLAAGIFHPTRAQLEDPSSCTGPPCLWLNGVTRLSFKVTDWPVFGANSGNRYNINFNTTGLVCEQKYPLSSCSQ